MTSSRIMLVVVLLVACTGVSRADWNKGALQGQTITQQSESPACDCLTTSAGQCEQPPDLADGTYVSATCGLIDGACDNPNHTYAHMATAQAHLTWTYHWDSDNPPEDVPGDGGCMAWGEAKWSISDVEDPGVGLCLLHWRALIAGQGDPQGGDGSTEEGEASLQWDADASVDEEVHAHGDVALAFIEPIAHVTGGAFGNEGSAVAESVIGFEEDGMTSLVWTD